ncbi:unnamed protein product [marine sediment metagenome]|uniref:Uncharacterized protein n=1 Tax=marine sediment metagenome TaxID=412755 RepID=X1N8J9_9ZZZZ
MLIEEFVKRRKLLEELKSFSDFNDDPEVLVVIQDKKMRLAERIRCPSLPEKIIISPELLEVH